MISESPGIVFILVTSHAPGSCSQGSIAQETIKTLELIKTKCHIFHYVISIMPRRLRTNSELTFTLCPLGAHGQLGITTDTESSLCLLSCGIQTKYTSIQRRKQNVGLFQSRARFSGASLAMLPSLHSLKELFASSPFYP